MMPCYLIIFTSQSFRKEELDNYKAQQNKAPVPDSDVLKMLQQTKIEDSKPPFAYVQGPNATEGLLKIWRQIS